MLHKDIALGRDLLPKICEALGVEQGRVRRVVLDVRFDAPVKAYVEMFASGKVVSIDWQFNDDIKIAEASGERIPRS